MNRISWFEIPVLDTARAVTFYDSIFGISIQAGPLASNNYQMSMFPDRDGVSGALMYGPTYTPSHTGCTVYLNGGDDLSVPLGKVEAAGGKILTPKTDIGDGFGFFAFFEDTEGNKIGLHSMG